MNHHTLYGCRIAIRQITQSKMQTQTELLRRQGKGEFPEYVFFVKFAKKLYEIENTYDLKGGSKLFENSCGSRTIFLSMVSSPTIGIDQSLSV